MTTDERLAKVEAHLSEVKSELSGMRGHGEQLSRLTAMVKDIKDQLVAITNQGFNRCAERLQMVRALEQRVGRLEGGEFPAMTAMEANQKAIRDELKDIKARLMPLEKRILMWIGGLGLVAFAAPFVFRYLMAG